MLRVPPVPTRPTRPVRIFSVDPRISSGHRYTVDSLKQAVENFNRYQRPRATGFAAPQAIYIPPADLGIGHDADELVANILRRTDWPSAGEPVKLWVDGKDLWAELDGVPEEIAAMANAGLFKEVSAEFYPDYLTPDGRHMGTVLRRISLLGSTPPRCKGLGRLPEFVYSEPRRDGRRAQNVVAVFSEGPFMTAEEARALLAQCGITNLEGVPDAFLIEMATKMKELVPNASGGGGSNLGGNGSAQMTPDQFAEKFGGAIAKIVAKENAPVLTMVQQLAATVGAQAKTAVRQECETFAESVRGKLYPFELDRTNEAYIVARLEDLPPAAREREMKAIRNRPDQRRSTFAEQVPDPTGHAAGEYVITGPDGKPHGRIVGGGTDAPSPERMKALRQHSKIAQGIDRRTLQQAARK